MHSMKEQLLQKIQNKTKPPGALGMLEDLALQAGMIQQTLDPVIRHPHIVVFAADHGIAASGKVNAYPQAVTAQMVFNFVNGGAAINVFCKQNHIDLIVVDAGVNHDFDTVLSIIHAKIRKGTSDYCQGPAMSIEEAKAAIQNGKDIVSQIHAKGCNTIGFGEMGIGNTSAAALIMHHYTGLPLQECVGRGTGANDAQLQQKITVLASVAKYHNLQQAMDAEVLLTKVGGFEIAMMAGAFLQAHKLGMIILVDGFIATAALYCAVALMSDSTSAHDFPNHKSTLLQNCVFSHTSNEQGHTKMLSQIGAIPLLNLGLRLGEGTGAALAMPLVMSAVNFLNEMASFETAGVSGSA